jgi:type VI secretion system secreted protein VgrG
MYVPYTQEKRLIGLEKSPLGQDVLLLTEFSGQEEMSRLFSFELGLLSAQDDISPKEIIGKNVTFSVKLSDTEARRFNGFVSQFSASSLNIRGMRLYRAQVVPWLWFLTRTADCRIFQNKTVPQIIEQIFKDLGFKDYDTKGIKGQHPVWDYCVQYRETDFNFISRLMEREGIFYWFRHTDDHKHILVLADHKAAYEDLPERDVEYVASRPEILSAGHVYSWNHQYQFRPGRWTHTDYNFETPSASLQTSTPTVLALSDITKYEIYDYPGEYQERGLGERLSKLRMEEEEAAYDVVEAASGCRSFQPGGKFTLQRHDCPSEVGKAYLVAAVRHSASEATYIDGDERGEEYSNTFSCIPADVTFRPRRLTPKPIVQGPQTAVVVGPSGEEIYTDQYGRVKVQFHWDREGKRDENSSCWVRVSHPWAGENWGAVAIPRIGQEVIVEFLEGDPDRPIITGRIYNAAQTPPYALPANKTQSGIKSRSSPGGGASNFNEIRFEDKKGQEQLYIHAEKNQDIEVEKDETHSVGNDRSKTIGHNETSQIRHDRTETVGHNETITVINDRTETVGGNETISVAKNRTRTVSQNELVTVILTRTHNVGVNEMINVGAAQEVTIGGLQAVTVGLTRAVTVGLSQNVTIGKNLSESVGNNHDATVGDNRSTKVGKDDSLNIGKNLTINAGDQIVIKTGDASIIMKKNGDISIKGKNIVIRGSGKISVKADSDVTIKGSKIGEN